MFEQDLKTTLYMKKNIDDIPNYYKPIGSEISAIQEWLEEDEQQINRHESDDEEDDEDEEKDEDDDEKKEKRADRERNFEKNELLKQKYKFLSFSNIIATNGEYYPQSWSLQFNNSTSKIKCRIDDIVFSFLLWLEKYSLPSQCSIKGKEITNGPNTFICSEDLLSFIKSKWETDLYPNNVRVVPDKIHFYDTNVHSIQHQNTYNNDTNMVGTFLFGLGMHRMQTGNPYIEKSCASEKAQYISQKIKLMLKELLEVNICNIILDCLSARCYLILSLPDDKNKNIDRQFGWNPICGSWCAFYNDVTYRIEPNGYFGAILSFKIYANNAFDLIQQIRLNNKTKELYDLFSTFSLPFGFCLDHGYSFDKPAYKDMDVHIVEAAQKLPHTEFISFYGLHVFNKTYDKSYEFLAVSITSDIYVLDDSVITYIQKRRKQNGQAQLINHMIWNGSKIPFYSLNPQNVYWKSNSNLDDELTADVNYMDITRAFVVLPNNNNDKNPNKRQKCC